MLIKTANIKVLPLRLILTITISGIKKKAQQAAYFAANYVKFYNPLWIFPGVGGCNPPLTKKCV